MARRSVSNSPPGRALSFPPGCLAAARTIRAMISIEHSTGTYAAAPANFVTRLSLMVHYMRFESLPIEEQSPMSDRGLLFAVVLNESASIRVGSECTHGVSRGSAASHRHYSGVDPTSA